MNCTVFRTLVSAALAAFWPVQLAQAREAGSFSAGDKGAISMIQAGWRSLGFKTDIVLATKNWQKQVRLDDVGKVRHTGQDNGRRTWSGVLAESNANAVAFEQQAEMVDGKLRLSVRVTARADMEVAGVHFFISLPVDVLRGGPCELIGPADPNSRPVAMPETLTQEHQFLKGMARGVKLADKAGNIRLTITLSAPADIVVQDGRKWNGDDFSIFWPLMKGKLVKGQSAEMAVTIDFAPRPDTRPVAMTLDAANRRYEFHGFGGNFCYNVETAVTDYNLRHIPMAWARVPMKLDQWEPANDNDSPGSTDWARFEATDRQGSEIRADFLLARKLSRLSVPYIISIWRVPGFMTAHPEKSPFESQRVLPREKWPEVMESIGAYLLYAKRKYGCEPAMISFNESDWGVNVLMEPQEHRDWIKALGPYLARLGLRTRLLLGDVTKNDNIAFIAPAAADADAMKYVSAVAYHTWSKGPDEFRAWRDAARRLRLPLLATEVGTDAQAHKDGSYGGQHYFANELRMYQQLLLDGEVQAVLEWEYTKDYSIVDLSKGPDGKDVPAPTARFDMIRQFAAATPRPAIALGTSSNHPDVLLTAFTDKSSGKRLVLHAANLAEGRKATITGLPAGMTTLQAQCSRWGAVAADMPPVSVRAGRVQLDLPPLSLITLTGAR